MADMTKEDFNEQADALGPNPDKEKIKSLLENIGSLDGYDDASLDKIFDLMESLGEDMPNDLSDTLGNKIIARRQQLEQSAAESPTAEAPVTETVQEVAPDELESFTSHDLLYLHTQYSENYENAVKSMEELTDPSSQEAQKLAQQIKNDAKAIKDIENYAAKELQELELSYEDPDTGEKRLLPCNAPTVQDYVDIMKAANPEYKYENEAVLQAALAEYDRVNGLTDEKPSPQRAAQVMKNAAEWDKLAPKDYDAQDFVKHDTLKLLKNIDKDVYNDMLETLRVATITELAKEEPGQDTKKAKKRFKDKYNDVATHYFAMAVSTLNQIKLDPEQQKMWWMDYCKAKGLPLENLGAIAADKTHQEAYNNYVISSVYKTLACTYTQTNSVYTSRLAQKTGMPVVLPIASQHNKKMWEKYPQVMKAVKESGKKAVIKSGASMLFGGIGATAAQIWQTTNDFKAEITKCKEANGGKVSLKSFAKYLSKNPDAAIKLARGTLMTATVGAAATAMMLSGGAAFGVVGTLAGAVVTNAATGIAIRTVKTVTATAISTVAGAATYLITRKAMEPKKQKMMELLEQCLPAEQQAEANKGLLARFTKGKNPAQQKYNELTKLWKNGDKALTDKVAELNLSVEQKAQIMQLAKEIKALKIRGWATVGTSVLGATATAYFMENGDMASSLKSGNGGSGHFDPKESWEDRMKRDEFVSDFDKKNTVEQVPLRPGEHLEQPEMGELHNLSLSNEDFAKITNGPNTIIALQNMMEHPDDFKNLGIDVEKIQAIGLDFKKLGIDFDEMRGSGSHVKTTAMINHLNNLQLSNDDQQKLHEIINSKEFSQVEELLNKRGADGNRLFIQPGGKVTISHQNVNDLVHSHTGNGSNGGNTVNAPKSLKEINLSQLQGAKQGPDLNAPARIQLSPNIEAEGYAKTSGAFSFLRRQHDFKVTIPRTGDLNKDVQNYAYGVAVKQQLAKAGVADVDHPTPEQDAAARAIVDQKGYHITGQIKDANGNMHSFKVVKHADGSLKRTIDGQKMSLNTENKNEPQFATYKKVKLSATTVVDPEAKAEAEANGGTYISKKLDKLRGKLTTMENGVKTTYTAVTDGDTGKDFLVKSQNGKSITQHVKNAAFSLKQLAKNAVKNR